MNGATVAARSELVRKFFQGRVRPVFTEGSMTAIICARASALFGLSFAAIACSSALAADQVPDIKGKWAGKTYSIVAGSGGHWPSSKGTFDKPGLFEKDLVIEVTN